MNFLRNPNTPEEILEDALNTKSQLGTIIAQQPNLSERMLYLLKSKNGLAT